MSKLSQIEKIMITTRHSIFSPHELRNPTLPRLMWEKRSDPELQNLSGFTAVELKAIGEAFNKSAKGGENNRVIKMILNNQDEIIGIQQLFKKASAGSLLFTAGSETWSTDDHNESEPIKVIGEESSILALLNGDSI